MTGSMLVIRKLKKKPWVVDHGFDCVPGLKIKINIRPAQKDQREPSCELNLDRAPCTFPVLGFNITQNGAETVVFTLPEVDGHRTIYGKPCRIYSENQ